MVFAFKALLVLSFSLLVGCSKPSTEPKVDEPLLTIEDSDFSHEADDGDWDGLEKVHAKFTAQWYVDPNDPEWGWNVERPEYVLREREVFLDGVCSAIKEQGGDEWLIRLYGPGYNFEGDWPPGDYFLYLHKHIINGKPWYDISWNANFEGEAASSKAQWNLGEDFQFD